jgi:hypothetical protein
MRATELQAAADERIHDLTHERDRLREQHRRVIDEFRAYRSTTICEPPRAA